MSNTGSIGATGNFVLSTQGNFAQGNRSFTPSANGNAFLTGQGFFMPTNGTFVPTFDGNFVLTVRAALDPKTGNFNPSPTGNFVFSQRGDIVSSSSGNLVPTLTSFNPTAAALANLQAARLANALTTNTAGTSPVTTSMGMNPYSYAPMSMSNPYTPSSTPYQGTSGTPATGSNPSSASSGAGAGRSEKTSTSTLGIPFEKGHIKWPLAFRLMNPEVKRNVADPFETDLLALAKQPVGGSGEGLVSAASRNLARLGAWLTVHQDDMAEATYQEGWTFLRMLDETVSAMR